MRCLRAISGVKLRDRVRNEAGRTALQMDQTITDTIKTKMLKWFGPVARIPIGSYVARVYHLDFPNPRSRGRPSKKNGAPKAERTLAYPWRPQNTEGPRG